MSQNYTTITSTTLLSNSLQPLLDRDDAGASNFSGSAFPSTNLLIGMLCYRTDQLKLYQLTATSPSAVWTLIYDLSSGSMTAPVASSVPWTGVSGKPTTVAGYGITDAMKKTGDSATGKISFLASAAGASSIGVPHGTAPSAPVNGDVWSTTGGFFFQINGSTFAVSLQNSAETYTAKKTFPAGSTSFASLNIPAGAAPTSPVNGDLWATATQLAYRMNGVSKNVAFWDANSIIAVANGGTGANNAATAKANLGISDIPSGSVMPFAGTSEPGGWCFCDGRWLVVASYPALFAAVGFTYGGDGSTYFAVPDLRGRVVAGKDNMGVNGNANRLLSNVNGNALGAGGGAETHQLSANEMPSHQHLVFTNVRLTDIAGLNIAGNNYAVRENDDAASSLNYRTKGSTTPASVGLTSAAGSGLAHNNVQPTIVLNYIIKL